jgi:lipoprotein-releasing system permease protein
MGYETWISLRYLTAYNRERFISLISLISISGVAIGVAALIIVLAVMTGFDVDLRDKIVGTNSNILVEREDGIKNAQVIQQELLSIPGIKATSEYINGRVFLQYSGNRVMNLALRGINPEAEVKVTKVKDYLVEGSLDLKDNGVLIGRELAYYMGLGVGDTITVISPAVKKWTHQLKIIGIFNSGMYDYDMNLLLVGIPQAQEIFSLGTDLVTGVSVKLNDIYQAGKIKKLIQDKIGFSYVVRTWMEINRNFFSALKLEKITMFIILSLIVLVAAFNIISTLIVIVSGKVKDIGILKALGASNASIRRIFTFQGFFIGLIGTLIGLGIGVALCLLLKKYQFIKLPQEVYYIDRLPVILQWQDIALIVLCAVVISFLSTIYPANKAAGLEPVEALRYE